MVVRYFLKPVVPIGNLPTKSGVVLLAGLSVGGVIGGAVGGPVE